jgi:3-phosphoshikimate 1-carboxyvinyltransferase
LRGSLRAPADKSLSHRVALFSAMAEGRSQVSGLLSSLDVCSTLNAVALLGAQVELVEEDGALSGSITGWGERGPRLGTACGDAGLFDAATEHKRVRPFCVPAVAPPVIGCGEEHKRDVPFCVPAAVATLPVIDCGNSGTTVRLLMGVLAGWPGSALLSGDASLRARPMHRVTAPLTEMGATFSAGGGGAAAAPTKGAPVVPPAFATTTATSEAAVPAAQTLPLVVAGHYPLRAISYRSPVASAQVKTAIILAGLRAQGTTSVSESALSRDHTELLLPAYGVQIERLLPAKQPDTPAANVPAQASVGTHSSGSGLSATGFTVRVAGGQQLCACAMRVPGDPSSAAFMLVAAALAPNSEVTVRGLLLNPTRTGFLAVMRRMGADITVREDRDWRMGAESIGDVTLRYSPQLSATEVAPEEVPSLIDELPILALLATAARGTTLFRGVGELRVKESDRLAAIVAGLQALGCKAHAQGDDLFVQAGLPTRAVAPPALGDHRLAMTWAVADAVFGLGLALDGREAVAVSYPGFFSDLRSLQTSPIVTLPASSMPAAAERSSAGRRAPREAGPPCGSPFKLAADDL